MSLDDAGPAMPRQPCPACGRLFTYDEHNATVACDHCGELLDVGPLGLTPVPPERRPDPTAYSGAIRELTAEPGASEPSAYAGALQNPEAHIDSAPKPSAYAGMLANPEEHVSGPAESAYAERLAHPHGVPPPEPPAPSAYAGRIDDPHGTASAESSASSSSSAPPPKPVSDVEIVSTRMPGARAAAPAPKTSDAVPASVTPPDAKPVVENAAPSPLSSPSSPARARPLTPAAPREFQVRTSAPPSTANVAAPAPMPGAMPADRRPQAGGRGERSAPAPAPAPAPPAGALAARPNRRLGTSPPPIALARPPAPEARPSTGARPTYANVPKVQSSATPRLPGEAGLSSRDRQGKRSRTFRAEVVSESVTQDSLDRLTAEPTASAPEEAERTAQAPKDFAIGGRSAKGLRVKVEEAGGHGAIVDELLGGDGPPVRRGPQVEATSGLVAGAALSELSGEPLPERSPEPTAKAATAAASEVTARATLEPESEPPPEPPAAVAPTADDDSAVSDLDILSVTPPDPA